MSHFDRALPLTFPLLLVREQRTALFRTRWRVAVYSQNWKNRKIVLCQRSFSIPPATHRGEDGVGRSGWQSRGLLTVTGRAPPEIR